VSALDGIVVVPNLELLKDGFYTIWHVDLIGWFVVIKWQYIYYISYFNTAW
jgi:hypothetical protein